MAVTRSCFFTLGVPHVATLGSAGDCGQDGGRGDGGDGGDGCVSGGPLNSTMENLQPKGCNQSLHCFHSNSFSNGKVPAGECEKSARC